MSLLWFYLLQIMETRAGTQQLEVQGMWNVFIFLLIVILDFSMFLDWLFSKDTQKDMTSEGRISEEKQRNFGISGPCRRRLKSRETVYVDGIYLAEKPAF